MNNEYDKYESLRAKDTETSNAVSGKVFWSPQKSIFLFLMYGISILGITHFFTLSAFLLFIVKTSAVLLLGHSVGMHRRLIHNSFECPLWLEYFLVYMGSLVGLGGPLTMIKTHDTRDWAQRKTKCHDYFAHRRPPMQDAWWQMHCDVKLDNPPNLEIEDRVKNSKFYHFIEKYWVAIHLPWIVAFYYFGGTSWVIWGVAAQIATTVTGHWLIGYIAHRDTAEDWHVRGAGVQGYNVKFCGLITMGECWHNNHHAFPGSAKIGIYDGQVDPGWWLVKTFEYFGLAKNVVTHEDLPKRKELEWIEKEETKEVELSNFNLQKH